MAFRNCLILNYPVDIPIDILYYHQRKNIGDFSFTKLEHHDVFYTHKLILQITI